MNNDVTSTSEDVFPQRHFDSGFDTFSSSLFYFCFFHGYVLTLHAYNVLFLQVSPVKLLYGILEKYTLLDGLTNNTGTYFRSFETPGKDA